MKTDIYKYFFVIFVNILLLAIFTILLELIFGNWIIKNKINQLNIPKNIKTIYKLNGLYKFDNDKIYYTRDKWGFRGNYDDISKIDILTIGGSTTDQKYISENYTFQDVIRDEFSKDNKKINIVNAGIDGQSTYGHIKNFDLWFNNIPNLNVEYYLFYIGVNDFYIEEDAYFDDLYGNKKDIDLLQKIKNQIKKNSVVYYLYRTLEGILIAYNLGISHNAGHTNIDPKTKQKTVFSKSNFTDQTKLNNYDFINKRVQQYGERIQILINKVDELKSKSIFVTQSSRRFWEKNNGLVRGVNNIQASGLTYTGVDYYYMSRKFNEKLIQICKDNNVIYIDLDSELGFNIEKDFYDQSHHNHFGARKIGIYLYSKLKKLF